VVGVYEGTVWYRRRVGVRAILAAIHAVFIAVDTTTSRRFKDRMNLRLDMAWRLLHMARAALPYFAPAARGISAQVLGFEAEDNKAVVVVSFGSGRLTFTQPADGLRKGLADDEAEAIRRRGELPLWLGLLRAWLSNVFRGVSKEHLWKYLAEFADRHGRVAVVDAARAAA
jgi:hypothetical protein